MKTSRVHRAVAALILAVTAKRPYRSAPAILAALVLAVLAPVAWADEVSYQGELRVQGQPFTGAARMKFVIIDRSTGFVLWSNDGTGMTTPPSQPPQQPSASAPISVAQGLFAVDLGGAGMTPIPDAAFAGVGNADLRLWISTGGAFEQFTDQPLHSSVFTHQANAVRQVDPAATEFLAKWDGLKLSRGTLLRETGGNVEIVSGGLKFPDGSVQTSSAGKWQLNNGNTVLTMGSVGINTTTPSPFEALDIAQDGNGRANIRTLGSEAGLTVGRADADKWALMTRGDVGGNNNDLKLLRYVGGEYRGITLQVQQFTGNVGIRAATQSPYIALDIGQDDSGRANIRALGSLEAGLAIGRAESDNWILATRADAGADNNDLKLLRYVGGAYQGNALEIQHATGNVGIGTAGLGARLTLMDADQQVLLTHPTATKSGSIVFNTANGTIPSGAFTFQRRTPAGAFEDNLLTIRADSGSVGLGTLNPQSRLHVAGDARVDGLLTTAVSGDLAGSLPAPTIRAGAVTDSKIASVSWSKITNVPPFSPVGTAGGDLAGTFPNPLVRDGVVSAAKLTIDASSLSRVSGGTMFASGGRIGVGTANPGSALEVRGGTGPTSLQVLPGQLLGAQAAGAATLEIPGGGVLAIWDSLIVDGNVGVGTTTPGERLTVAGRIHSTAGGFVFPNGTVQTTAWNGVAICTYNSRQYSTGAKCLLSYVTCPGPLGTSDLTLLHCSSTGSWSQLFEQCSSNVYPTCGQ